jgi:hypothetical protein
VIDILSRGLRRSVDVTRAAVLGETVAGRVEDAHAAVAAPDTLAAHRAALLALAQFVAANPILLVGVSGLSADVWDALLEAFVLQGWHPRVCGARG